MKSILKWLNNPYVIVILLVTVVIADLVSLGRAYDLSKSDWGTWVGAFGTVLALGVAIYVSERQHQSAMLLMNRSESIALDRRLRSVLAVLDEAFIQVGNVKDRLLGEGQYSTFLAGIDEADHDARFNYLGGACTTDLSKPQFVDLIDVINQIPIHELGHKELVQAVFTTRRQLINYEETLKSLTIEVDKYPPDKTGCLSRAWNASKWTVFMISSARDQFEKRLEQMTAVR